MTNIVDIAFEFLSFIDQYMIIIVGLLLICYVIISASLYFIYDKVGIKRKFALFPIYNYMVLLKLISLPKWLVFLIFIPYVNYLGIIIMSLIIGWRLGNATNKGFFFKIGLMILPMVFFPLLAKQKVIKYEKLPESRKLIREKVKENDANKENIIKIDEYKIEDINLDGKVDALDIMAFINNGLPDNTKVNDTVAEKKEKTSGDDITFDYDELYNKKEDKSLESELNMNTDQNMINVQVPVATTVPEVAPIPVAGQVPVAPTQVVPMTGVQGAPVAQAPVAPTPVVQAAPVQQVPVAAAPAPAVLDANQPAPIPVAPDALSVSAAPAPAAQVAPVAAPVQAAPVAPIPVAPDAIPVAPQAVEVTPNQVVQNPQVAPVPVASEVANIPVAPVPVQPAVVPEMAAMPPTAVQPVVTDVPVVAQAPVAQAPVMPEVAQNQVLETSVVAPVGPEVLPQQSGQQLVSGIPEVKPQVSVITEPGTGDAFTFDYNQLYNIQPVQEVEEVPQTAPVAAPVEQMQPVVEEQSTVTDQVSEFNPMNNFTVPVNTPQTMNSNDISAGIPEINNGESVFDSNQSFDTLVVAAPPSFEIPEVPTEIKEEEPIPEIVPEVKKEDLVSVQIDEPEILPVGNLTTNNIKSVSTNNVVEQSKVEDEKNASPFDSVPSPGSINNVQMTDNNNQGGSMQMMNPFTNSNDPVVIDNIQDDQVARASVWGGNIGQAPVNNVQPQQVNQQSANYRNPSTMNSQRPITNNVSLLRENEDDRAVEEVQHGPKGSKFIDDSNTKYTLPKEKPIPINEPTDPALIANPMSIFGNNTSGLRPTSEEAMQQAREAEMLTQQGSTVCPNCGFVVKPGQTSCVVCGFRIQ